MSPPRAARGTLPPNQAAALQPRFGWLLPNLAFTASHAHQYGPDALLSVFVLGAVLAGIRARWSTSLSIVAHIL